MNPRKLIEAHLHGDLDAKGHRQLVAWLRVGDANVEEFVRATHVHAALPDVIGQYGAAAKETGSEPLVFRLRVWRVLGPLAAAAVLVAVGGAWWWGQRSDNSLPPAATVTAVTGACRIQNAVCRVGNKVKAGMRIETGKAGGATLRLPDGSIIDLHCDTELALPAAGDSINLFLKKGDLYCVISRRKAGEAPFCIGMPGRALAVVMGTKFELRQREDKTSLAVEKGVVRMGVHAPGARLERQDVTTLQGLTVQAGNVSELKAVSWHDIAAWKDRENDTGLVAWWKLDETSGAEAEDSSGNNNTGLLVGGPAWTKGKSGNGLSLDGHADYMYVINASSFGLTSAIDEITISAWIKTTAGNAAIVGIKNSAPGSSVIELALGTKDVSDNTGAGRPSFLVRDDNGHGQARIHGASAINDNQWHHVVAQRTSGKALTIYVDGAIACTGADTMSAGVTPDNVRIGDEALNDDIAKMNGLIDDVRIYNRALTVAEIMALAGK